MTAQSKSAEAQVGFLTSLWGAYLKQLIARPVLTKSVTQLVFSGLQEWLAQHFTGAKQYDWDRIIKLSLYGFLISSPFSHYMIEFMNYLLANNTSQYKTILQLLFANLLTLPISVSLYFVYLAIIDGRDVQQMLRAVPAVVQRLWRFYPPAQILVYRYLPAPLWLPFFQIYGLILGVFTSIAAKRAAAASAAGRTNKT